MKSDTWPLPAVRIGRAEFDFSRRTSVMGILNVTPDSFSDGGLYRTPEEAIRRGLEMAEEGADIIDVGGESTRPGGVYGATVPVSEDEELARVIPVIEGLAQRSDVTISVDTTKSAVAEAALSAGASMVNDISGLSFDGRMAAVVARHQAALVVMHIQGRPETMQQDPRYADVVAEVRQGLHNSVAAAEAAGVNTIIIDPGIGFGKTLEHNLSLIKHLGEFRSLGRPILIGTSRKGFIGAILDRPVNERIFGTAASVALAVRNGANIVRVHDVRAMKQTVMVADRINRAE